ncbi:MAG: formylmethanofuran dehydrogenase [Alphaproteobacteria bacterium BRH_c36]|nr:MAG: formylmethanofuran dehydrogenase [Alphaproteobacteria bacterium BRH_c36]
MSEVATAVEFDHVPCPFCGLVCDDLQVVRTGAALKVTKNGCSLAVTGFERALPATSPQVGGRDVSVQEAVAEAARLIRKSSSPLYGGLSTDVAGMRAVMSLADRSRGTLDHAFSSAFGQNMKVLQSAGWITSTLTETRNRADVIVIVGSDVHALHPRFFERIVRADTTMFEETDKPLTVVFIGEGLDQSAASGPRVGKVVTLPCPLHSVDEVMGALLARMRGNKVSGDNVAGVPLAAIEGLAKTLSDAHYSVLVYTPAGLHTDDSDLTVHAICDVVRLLNKTTRSAGLSLGGDEGATTATSVCGWQSGFPTRVSFASGAPDYDPITNELPRKLAGNESDLLVWLASYSPDLAPPDTDVPTILLAPPAMTPPNAPAVFIPVGTPGLDHAGQLIRCDSVVSLHLRDLGRSKNPSVASVLTAIEAAL